MPTYYGKKGKSYQLGAKIGSGFEGTVYRVSSDPQLVAKIFHGGKKDPVHMQRKIETMMAMAIKPEVDGILRCAWPRDILTDGGRFVGYVMPYVKAPYEIFQVYRDDTNREKILPGFNWKYSIQYAYNLSWVVWYLHMNGIVIGDMNMKNIRINSVGEVVIIDCDSFDIVNPKTKEHFPCTVGLPEMLAPELQTVGNLANGRFTKETDDFSLAIHIFRLLMNNADPFGAKLISKKKPSISAVNVNAPIINGECVYVRDVPGKAAPDWAPPFEMLPQEIQDAFRRTFYYTALTAKKNIKNRTTAEEWNKILLNIAPHGNNPRLKICPRNPRHIYPAHNTSCPWCGSHRSRLINNIAGKIGY